MIKKKLSVFLIILFLLTGCGNSFKPEEVTYGGELIETMMILATSFICTAFRLNQ